MTQRESYQKSGRRLTRSAATRLYALAHPKKVEAFRLSPTLFGDDHKPLSLSQAREAAWACRRRLTPRRVYLSGDHLGFRYEPSVKQWRWGRSTLWANWRERERQQRGRGLAAISCRAETGRPSEFIKGAPELCRLPIGHEGPHRG